ncbi:hypothetical protein BGP77_07270 [Saccharospirillum sp. MSK14-1]|uniref:DUF1993 family protein n=1 Tax=Saccharospirillum sp. MSK14-1 TaxID=1897632 RepID=UPI000D388E11|nr:DUF1993 family protein [Saccharospirillum sp. MSK14-1]PTY37072.1 hypothetical protein BGP77_07270 [Saccharospirillum sp. MSK14-1]
MIELQPLLLRYLQQLIQLLEKIPEECFQASLAPDMFSLAEQARIASNYSLRLYCPLIRQPVPQFDQQELSKSALLQEVSQRRDYLRRQPAVTELSDARRINERAGFADLELSEPHFIQHYGLPNFFFHLSMVYAIARQHGVALSKADFDGYHDYPGGFSFIQPGSDE